MIIAALTILFGCKKDKETETQPIDNVRQLTIYHNVTPTLEEGYLTINGIPEGTYANSSTFYKDVNVGDSIFYRLYDGYSSGPPYFNYYYYYVTAQIKLDGIVKISDAGNKKIELSWIVQ